ncbi:MAG: chemotaxis protein CheW [Pseudomonadota bacterium]
MNSQVEEKMEAQYLIFDAGGNKFCASLEDISEVLEVLPLRQVPSSEPSFLGIGSLRGQLISVLDLRKRFSLPEIESAQNVILVVEARHGFVGLKVDRVLSVASRDSGSFESNPNYEVSVPVKFISGVFCQNEEFIPCMAVKAMIETQKWVTPTTSDAA